MSYILRLVKTLAFVTLVCIPATIQLYSRSSMVGMRPDVWFFGSLACLLLSFFCFGAVVGIYVMGMKGRRP